MIRLCSAVAVWATFAASAYAFCGFYVSGSSDKLSNNATQVVLMRDGTRTVLSMQNNYQGPPKDFALVIPVPVILQKENVKTLDKDVFDRLDTFDAPRLVEYWEQDPCYEPPDYSKSAIPNMMPAPPTAMPAGGSGSLGVKIEAQFTVGEYEIVILSAEYSTGLDTWLKLNNYNIPEGAAPILKPYVERGMKFFVAKVDTTKVKFDDEENALLSPLRFHYDSDTFELPVRLGLLNAKGDQDLIIHMIGPTRFETSNYKNVTIPTNLNVSEEVKGNFASFYASLFDATLAKNKDKQNPVVTEYAWDVPPTSNQFSNATIAACDPCPPVLISLDDLVTLGADVLPSTRKTMMPVSDSGMPLPPRPILMPPTSGPASGPASQPEVPMFELIETPPLVLTRLHARYGKESLGEDLVFQKAGPIVGGREFVASGGKLEEGAHPSSTNNFQGRYAIRYPWKGPINCLNPKRGVWGGPWPGVSQTGLQPAKDLAFTKRGADLPSLVRQDVPELGIKAKQALSLSSQGGYMPFLLIGAGAVVLSLLVFFLTRRKAA